MLDLIEGRYRVVTSTESFVELLLKLRLDGWVFGEAIRDPRQSADMRISKRDPVECDRYRLTLTLYPNPR